MSGHDALLVHARRYFQAAAQGTDRRKIQVLVMLGLDYLKLAARLERSEARRRVKRPKRRPAPALMAEEEERLAHDPEKACPGLDPGCVAVSGQDHAQTKN